MYFEDMWEIAPSVFIWPHAASLWPWPLTSKSNQFMFVPNYTKVVNLVKFAHAVYKICFFIYP